MNERPPPELMPVDPKKIGEIVAGHGHSGALGLRFVGYGSDWCEFALDYREELIGERTSGVLASGPIIALMDVTTSISVAIRNGGYRPQATLDLRVDYLRAATPGKTIIGRGECYRVTRRIAFVRGIAHDGDPDDLIANVAGTFMFTEAE